jgi:hypothetical protein
VPALAATAAAASAPAPTVTRIEMVARPATFRGTCPTRIKFTGAIEVSAYPATVQYRWERSDGGTMPKHTLTIRGRGMGVNETWDLGGTGTHDIWMKIHVLSPNDIVSDPAKAKVVCK